MWHAYVPHSVAHAAHQLAHRLARVPHDLAHVAHALVEGAHQSANQHHCTMDTSVAVVAQITSLYRDNLSRLAAKYSACDAPCQSPVPVCLSWTGRDHPMGKIALQRFPAVKLLQLAHRYEGNRSAVAALDEVPGREAPQESAW